MSESLSQTELRLDPPWLINNKDLIACCVYQGIVCKTWPTLPRKLDVIVDQLRRVCEWTFERMSDDFYLKEFNSYDELRSWLKDHLLAIPEIEEMNLSDEEYARGVQVEDEGRAYYAFSDRYSPPCPAAEDFVDLDAYVRNVCHDLLRQQIEINFSTFPPAQDITKRPTRMKNTSSNETHI